MLIKYGLESFVNLNEKEKAKTKQLNEKKEGTIMTKVFVQGMELELFGYVDVEVKVELKGFHKIMDLKITK